MIGKLQGAVEHIGPGFVIVTTGGVGYKVMLGANALLSQKTGANASFWIETIVREDAISLIGFASLAEQEMFVKLTTVSNVGPKSALAILGALKLNVLANAIASKDAKTLATAPGVGKKVAERIIVELKDKVEYAAGNDGSGDHGVYAGVLDALESLGYRRGDCVELVQKLVKENPGDDIKTVLTKALREYASK